ncbi:hypothetical protein SUGI_0193540 [Cryptomeria japonica]|uniref:riboflavin biosynthesis protein PYRR, chloroplastic n=1 Tax=Cryptomeria japonica TaxID=3369 RepID=UPI0024089454|nr:riboflavin biosynthesis protein PYRR, chloroplastic [Cryptomeria japonica]XP_057826807.2 riboflavin biosynthesis protein PYRR, chloroplastic [Cryptomeria japonica]GLJ12561.1 hypothetical protein SUGI_0193540 [Cryptomeria japonica]
MAMAFSMPDFWPTAIDAGHVMRAATIAGGSAGQSAPHPNSGCVIARGPKVISEGFLSARGGKSAEIKAIEKASEHAKGATAYLNLEPFTTEALNALCEAGIGRVVVGLKNPVKDQKGKGIETLRRAGAIVDIVTDLQAVKACQSVNLPLIYSSLYGIPFSVLKYAMTLDGKIAASGGHAAWVSGHMARSRVFELRSRCDGVLVGGNTVRRDDPLLTTRQIGGHKPVRIVMSASLDLPENAKLWDVSAGPTIVATARGARRDFQRVLVSRGVEVVEFDPVTPRAVMEYLCRQRGFLSVLWECGGGLSAPAISDGVIHKVVAFVAPKIIGGAAAPCPVGELGFVKMTDALKLADVSFQQVGDDMLVTGYLHTIPMSC